MSGSFAGRLLSRAVVAASLAIQPALVSSAVGATAPEAAREVVIDITLQPGQMLIGQLVDPNGAPQADAEVTILLTDGSKAVGKTNAEGGFAFRGVNGVARLESDKAVAVIRSWEPAVAPPSAVPALLLVEQEGVARGQAYPGPMTQGFVSRSKSLLANPLFVAGAIGTAVAIPVAIHNDDDPVSP